MKIALIGMSYSGKTTLAQVLSKKYKMDCFDVDALIEKDCKQTISQIFEIRGEAGFRRLETQKIQEIAAQNLDKDCVVALGGGAILDCKNREALQDFFCVFLYVSITDLYQRLALDTNKTRPLLKNDTPQALQAMYEFRLPIYREFCHCEIVNQSCDRSVLIG
ncbi:MAG: shikimate kinase, partial [Firmicutes bacterium]|nr:shikimate kinase [Bacillota bacterium]